MKRKLHVAKPDHRYHFIKCSCDFRTGSFYWKKYAETHYKAHLRHRVVKDEHRPSYRTCDSATYLEEMRIMSNKIKSGRWRPEL